MKFNFTEDVRAALSSARDEAVRLGHDFVGTEHLLLGALSRRQAVEFFQSMGVSVEKVRSLIEESVRPGGARILKGDLPYSSRAKKALEFAMAAARELRSETTSVEHLLLGLLREKRGLAADVLTQVGVSPELLHQGVGTAPQARGRRFRVILDDAAGQSIYEQIIAQVTEAAATGELQPGERMPTVRQLADELDIAPGTVARAYSELERQGLVITEGVRGTRIADRAGSPRAEVQGTSSLTGLLRPVVVAAFHLGATASDLRAALEAAMSGIFDKQSDAA